MLSLVIYLGKRGNISLLDYFGATIVRLVVLYLSHEFTVSELEDVEFLLRVRHLLI